MVDSSVVLWGQTLAYTLYFLAMILLVGFFHRGVIQSKLERALGQGWLSTILASMAV